MAKIARGQATMKIWIGTLFATFLLALGFAAPAQSDDSPWYMPPAWVYPPQSGPKISFPPGYYSYNYDRAKAYGSGGTGCYGTCGYNPGYVTTGNYVVLSKPVVS